MEDSDINSTWMDPDNDSSSFSHYDIEQLITWVIITVGLVLMPVAIYAVCSLVKKDNVAPIYVINLLISDIVQLCSLILMEARLAIASTIGKISYIYGVTTSVGFMVCIALERYLVIVWPLWYRTSRTVKMSLVVCAVVWALPVFLSALVFMCWFDPLFTYGLFLLLPFPLLIFFLVGTLKALSVSISVRAEEKRRIVGLLVLVLLIYTLLFLPVIIYILVDRSINLHLVSLNLIRFNPLADLFLYIFLKKGAVKQVLFCLCRCSRQSTVA